MATFAGVARPIVQRVDGEAAVTHVDSAQEREARGIDVSPSLNVPERRISLASFICRRNVRKKVIDGRRVAYRNRGDDRAVDSGL